MASASSLAQLHTPASRKDGSYETLEIDPQFASSLGFSEGDVVEIGLLHDLPVAKSVGTEPYSSDDWEILVLILFLPLPPIFGTHTHNLSRKSTPLMSRITSWLKFVRLASTKKSTFGF